NVANGQAAAAGQPVAISTTGPAVTINVANGQAGAEGQTLTATGPAVIVSTITVTTSTTGQAVAISRIGDETLIGPPIPTTITLASLNEINEAAATISHAIATSSSPGGAAAILATDNSGLLHLRSLIADEIAGDLTPDQTDTRNIGSITSLWRTAYISEMQATLFAKNTASLIGGLFIIPHNAGTLAADVSNSTTQIDFGQPMTTGDIILLRGLLQVEYMQIGTAVTGTTYNVTRNLDGSGVNTWPAGQAFAVLGTSGDGRIELDAQTGQPRISILEQGTIYNSQVEKVRIGALNGWGSLTGNGIAIGDPTGERITYDPTNGLIIAGDGNGITNINGGNIQANTVTATQINVSNLSAISANLGTITAGTITGATIRTAATGARVQMDTSGIFGTNGTTEQWRADNTTGKFTAGNGYLNIDENGLTLTPRTSTPDFSFTPQSLKWANGTTTKAMIEFAEIVDHGTSRKLVMGMQGDTRKAELRFTWDNVSGIEYAALDASLISLIADETSVSGDLNVTGSYKKENTTGHIYVPFRTGPVQPTGWAGTSKTSGTYTLTAADLGVPSNAAAIAIQIGITGGTTGNSLAIGYASYVDAIFAQIQSGLTIAFASGVTNLDTSGQITASVSGTINCYIRIIGYYI
ncbi:MAG: hypothetical protein CUN56_00005, partial [Phototrophicales bacterium]